MKFNWKNKRYVQYQLEFYQEKQLTHTARELYSFIFNHCLLYSNDEQQGWCGFSNDRLAKNLNTTTRTIVRNIRELTEKEMIIIENPKKRTKKTGESRQIHINAKNYIVEENPGSNIDNELLKIIERQSKELETLKKENTQLKLKQSQLAHITELGYSLIRIGFITEEQYKAQAEELNHILLDFERWHTEGRALSQACFRYWNAHKETEIKNPVRYLLTCIEQSKSWINKKDNHINPNEYYKNLEEKARRWDSKDE